MWYELFIKKNLLPELIIRLVLKIHLILRFNKEPKRVEELEVHLNSIVTEMKKSPICVNTDVANQQHYELPPEFFQLVLGKHLKYSCGLWKNFNNKIKLLKELDRSEEDMLKLTEENADIREGQRILDLGCGWGSFSLFLASKYPDNQITAITNSYDQKKYIDSIIALEDIKNLNVIKVNINNFETEDKFDRIVSVEMFEHMRNYKLLLEKLSNLLNKEGKLFIHIFTDDRYPYFFKLNGRSNWMAANFFRGGLMPSVNLIFKFLDHFTLQKMWRLSGRHYKNTLDAWLYKMKINKDKVREVFTDHYGASDTNLWWNYWRMFFIALSEVFGYKKGNKRFISHYLLKKK